MKNDTNDLVKKKMESLTTLSGGIVFGKEEAWEKLQVRLESKPAKKIKLSYWMAAAAVLLALVCVMTTYHFSEKEMATKNNKEKINGKGNSITTVQTPALRIPEKPVTIGGSEAVAVQEKHVSFTSKGINKTEPPKIKSISAIDPVVVENKLNNAPVLSSAPIISVAKPMRVIHINDLEKPAAGRETPSITANTAPTLDLSKLRVVYINDVEREEAEVKKIMQENRMTLGHYPFVRPAFNYSDIEDHNESNQYAEPRNPLKNIFNPQN